MKSFLNVTSYQVVQVMSRAQEQTRWRRIKLWFGIKWWGFLSDPTEGCK
jgi:hypothetical protein